MMVHMMYGPHRAAPARRQLHRTAPLARNNGSG
jgi:hypothetical protein